MTTRGEALFRGGNSALFDILLFLRGRIGNPSYGRCGTGHPRDIARGGSSQGLASTQEWRSCDCGLFHATAQVFVPFEAHHVSDYTLLWAIVLLLVSLGFLVLETFIPSWGVLGFFAAVSALGGVGLAFYSGPLEGVIVLGASLVVFPLFLYFGVKWWPKTPVGKRVLLPVPSEEDVLPDTPQLRQLKLLLGKLGRAKTVMLPSGPVDFDGRTVDCVSEGMPVEAGQVVKVIEVRGMRVVVRAVDDENLDKPQARDEGQDRPLRPLDSLNLDELDEE
jgi:hypothetical protein